MLNQSLSSSLEVIRADKTFDSSVRIPAVPLECWLRETGLHLCHSIPAHPGNGVAHSSSTDPALEKFWLQHLADMGQNCPPLPYISAISMFCCHGAASHLLLKAASKRLKLDWIERGWYFLCLYRMLWFESKECNVHSWSSRMLIYDLLIYHLHVPWC